MNEGAVNSNEKHEPSTKDNHERDIFRVFVEIE